MKLYNFIFFIFSVSICFATKPNVVLFVVDDLGNYDLSCNGSKFYETPNADALAESGMQFTSAYVSHPRCTSSRYSIQTGKYPARVRIPGGNEQISLSEVTIGEAFQEAGYTTFFAGKWHLGATEAQWPQNQGYDINVAGCHAGAPPSYFYPYNVKKPGDNSKHKEIVGLEDGGKGEYITDRLTEETVAFIQEHGDEPFFLTLCHYAVHTPLQAKKEKIEKYEKKLKKLKFEGVAYIDKDGTTKMHQDNAIYAAMIESMDESLGALVKTLKEENILDNTIIVFTSDHGGLSNRGINSKRQLATSNLPLRAGKGHLYEGGIKVPFIVYYPKMIKPNSVCEQTTINTHIYPTLLDLAGIPLKPENHLDGISIKSAIMGNKLPERKLFWHSPVARPGSTGDENCSSVRWGNYKLLHFYDKDVVELYNLENDPNETNNIINQQEKTALQLQEDLKVWKQEVNAFHKKRKN